MSTKVCAPFAGFAMLSYIHPGSKQCRAWLPPYASAYLHAYAERLVKKGLASGTSLMVDKKLLQQGGGRVVVRPPPTQLFTPSVKGARYLSAYLGTTRKKTRMHSSSTMRAEGNVRSDEGNMCVDTCHAVFIEFDHVFRLQIHAIATINPTCRAKSSTIRPRTHRPPCK